jgi:hypothetical protein
MYIPQGTFRVNSPVTVVVHRVAWSGVFSALHLHTCTIDFFAKGWMASCFCTFSSVCGINTTCSHHESFTLKSKCHINEKYQLRRVYPRYYSPIESQYAVIQIYKSRFDCRLDGVRKRPLVTMYGILPKAACIVTFNAARAPVLGSTIL